MNSQILLGHGSGGQLSHDLIERIFINYFHNDILVDQTDSAILSMNQGNLAFTTDSYVVDPIIFPGGNIGKIAVCGTVNDLAVSGAEPKYIAASFIIEEGLPFQILQEIVKSMAEEAEKAGVLIVTGDTKVVNKGKSDKLFITTSGVGIVPPHNMHIAYGKNIQPGDAILINGHIGDHGIAVMGAREVLSFSNEVQSDCASLNHLIKKVLDAGVNMKFMRDATRGGVATVLAEVTKKHKLGIEIEEDAIPIRESVKGLCEIFGFDPLYVANEGKVVMIIAAEDVKKALEIMKNEPTGMDSIQIGNVTTRHPGKVVLNTSIGGKRMVDMLAGEQLPRIC
ncbi:MAG: hydrogenase expression/formation protein HypE [Bacteroidales bacterium]|nr:hydrogenase expression/formation protein HypE [Bacteroidales bacterium]